MQTCHAITARSIKLSYNYMEKTSHTTLVFELALPTINVTFFAKVNSEIIEQPFIDICIY